MRLWRRLVPPDPRHEGTDPDYRFTLANERTFLAWIRTSLAFAAGGLGAVGFLDDFSYSEILGIGLLGVACVTAASAYRRWARTERAMRVGEPLPPSLLPQVMALSTAAAALLAAVLVVVDRA